VTQPLAVDLFCGLGGWTEGLLAAGYRILGFDIERHEYAARLDREDSGVKVGGIDFNGYGKPGYKAVAFNGTAEKRLGPKTGGVIRYPAQLVLQDILTVHGSQFRDAALIVASPPCQNYSYLAMPWSRSTNPENSQAAKELRKKWETEGPDNRLFDACFRIQREASEAAGRYIPMVVENVRGAQPWVVRSRANYGSFHLWGDVEMIGNRIQAGSDIGKFGVGLKVPRSTAKIPGQDWNRFKEFGEVSPHWRMEATKTVGHINKRDGHSHTRHLTNQSESDAVRELDGTKIGGDWFSDPNSTCRKHGSRSNARKAASAMIAKIPLPLAEYIARAHFPR